MKRRVHAIAALTAGAMFLCAPYATADIIIEPVEESFETIEETAEEIVGVEPDFEAIWQRIDSISRDSVNYGYNPLLAPAILPNRVPAAIMKQEVEQPGYGLQQPRLITIEGNRNLYRFYITNLLAHPESIKYAEWQLPLPPELPADKVSYSEYLSSVKIPGYAADEVNLPTAEFKKIHWLHVFDSGLQFSQAYLSRNWYQGGNNYLALLFNFGWNVALNQAYHPDMLFESAVSYKLGLNSVQNDEYHKYSISEDLFQWNLKAGVKAFHRRWFYTMTLQFKTQLFNNYLSNSPQLSAALLSPADLNIGLGMTYKAMNAKKTWVFNASIAPISYNLKSCINNRLDPTQFGIEAGHKFHNEVGSSATLTFDWKCTSDITYKSRFFAFTDYKNYYHDWENTINFSINRFLSTQVFVHLRYDTASDLSLSPKWKHWMLKEILSFGFAYHFQTKPPK